MATEQQDRSRGAARWAWWLMWGLILAALMTGGGAAADDTAPVVLAVAPAVGAEDVALAATLTVTFSEPVTVAASALQLGCERSSDHPTTVQGDGQLFTFIPDAPFAPGEHCTARLRKEAIADQDGDDPPDQMVADFVWSFDTVPPPLLINEIDSLTTDDTAEFIELFDGGAGHTPLDGLTLVFYRGDKDSVYLALDLSGLATDGRGYFVVGGPAINADLRLAVGSLRDGPDAVALFAAPKSSFLVGAPVVTEGLLDAVVYAPDQTEDDGLAPLLLPGHLPLDEAQRGAAMTDSLQRYPNGDGAARDTSAYIVYSPTPDAANEHPTDDAPRVMAVWPEDGATITDVAAPVEVIFSEPVTLHDQPVEINCSLSGEHTYALNGNGTTYHFHPSLPLLRGESCTTTVFRDRLSDADLNDPPDGMLATYTWSFATAPPVPQTVLINEIDADTPGSDSAEFIELYDGGAGHTLLDGLLLVLFNGGDDRSYRTIDLSGRTTDAAGYFLVANASIAGADLVLANGALQNGTDAVALLDGQAADYPNGTPVAGLTPLDAVVYGPTQPADAGLLSLLNAGQAAVDENGRGEAEIHSNQRCPNGSGGARNTAGFRQNTPTPRAASSCATDNAPTIIERSPAPGAVAVGVAAPISVTFSEPVTVSGAWLTITCGQSGTHPYATTGGPVSFVLQPSAPFAHDETCTVVVKAQRVHDLDTDDPPDTLAGNVTWQFTTTGAPPDFLLINEIDADTPGSDTAEFVELYDGGQGATSLDGLVLVFYNGYANTTYLALDLDGQRTSAAGYWVAGNAALSPGLVFANGGLQNGPDAVALYAGDAAQFPADSPLTTDGLLDAVVYGDAAGAAGLLPLLLANEPAADEGGRGAADRHALQRCPNGAGGQRRTGAFRPNDPTPGAASHCTADAPPTVLNTTPPGGAEHVAVDVSLTVEFSEPMTVAEGWLRLVCAGQARPLNIAADGATAYTAIPVTLLPHHTLCVATIDAELLHDADSDDPPDQPAADFTWSFTTLAPVAGNVLINELDADTPGNDAAEFIELTDGGAGNTDLAGLVLVLFNGKDDRAYYAVDLDGARTSSNGLAVIGSAGPGAIDLPAAVIQNGADAVALYEGDATDFPAGTPVTTSKLRDAIVYGTADPTDAGLLPLLLAGEAQFDEAARGAADLDSAQRCPDGAGGARRTAAYRANRPTPGAPNDCDADDGPAVLAVSPPDQATGVAANAALTVQFSEAVTLSADWFTIACAASGSHAAATTGGPEVYTLTPAAPFVPDERCTVTLHAARIHDADSDDPPDSPAADFVWSFYVAPASPATEGILINELDADTAGNDTTDFIELYDGGRGRVDLSGLVVVLWNGRDDTVYAAIDLTGHETDTDGTFVLGRAGLAGVDLLLPAAIQNGPDAVTLYAGRAADFPNGRPLSTAGLRDALVYGPGDAPDEGLLTLLADGQLQRDEGERGDATADALQRCPNGEGGPRRTAAYRAAAPTPGQANNCVLDAPPGILAVRPSPDSTGVAPSATLAITFTEPIDLSAGWIDLACGGVAQPVTALPGDTSATVVPGAPLPAGAACAATIRAAAVADRDANDPPDHPATDYTWHFQTAAAPPPLVAGFSHNGPVWIEATVVFTNTTTGPGTPSFLWDFGDGHGATTANPTHHYAAAGSYTVTLTATLGATTARFSDRVEVWARAVYAPLVVGR